MINIKYYPILFCLAYSAIALTLGLFLTQSGSGISPDSIMYISSADNLHQGNGLGALVYAAPLYPILITGVIFLGFSAIEAARLVPIICFTLLMFPVFYLGKALGSSFIGYIACLICLVLTPILMLASFSWTEMPYILFSVTGVLFLVKFTQSGKSTTLCIAAVFIALAFATRYVGVSLIIAGLAIVMIKNRSQLKRALLQSSLFGILSCLPMLPWIYWNTVRFGSFGGYTYDWGKIYGKGVGLYDNLYYMTGAIVNSLFGVSSSISLNIQWLAPVAAVVLVLLVLYRTTDIKYKKALQQYLHENYAAIICIVIYLLAILLLRTYWHEKNVYSRYITVIYPLLIATILSLLLYIYRQTQGFTSRRVILSVLVIVCVCFTAIHINSSLSFYAVAKEGQIYTASEWRNNEGLAWIEANADSEATVYANNTYPPRLRLENEIKAFPRSGNVTLFLEGLESGSYVVCFKVKGYEAIPPYTEVMDANSDSLVLVAEFEDSVIWQVK